MGADQSKPCLSSSEVSEIKKLFKQLDKDKSGELDRAEFAGVFAQHPALRGLSAERACALFDAFDKDGSGSVSQGELLSALGLLLRGSAEEKLDFLFTAFDEDGSGTLSRAELEKVLAHMAQVAAALGRAGPRTESFVAGVLQKLDEDRDGRVTRAEWRAVGLRTPSLLYLIGVNDSL
eukprot:m51a1_g8946 hypothetical protein (178) ;mRNA; f:992798-993452